MKTIRIIPRLDIKGPNLVKGIHLEGLRVLGKPEVFAKYYYEHGADELIYMDVVASLYNRNSLNDIISRTARSVFIPLTVGGGLRTLQDIENVLRSGADKVSINSMAVNNPDIIRQAARRFGSSTIVVSIEVIRQADGRYLAYTDNGREYTGIEVYEWAKRVEALGAGEILLTSVDREGTGKGFDIELIKLISPSVSIPVIACGGCGCPGDVKEAVVEAKADAVAIASVLHYGYLNNGSVIDNRFEEEGNMDYLKSGINFSKIKPSDLEGIKSYIHKEGISCRNVSLADSCGALS